MNSQRDFLAERYQRLWEGAIAPVRRGNVTIDPLLASREPDRRRCLTLLARPSAAVQGTVNAFLERLRAIDPQQYYYDPGALHVTILSLFTATVEYEKHLVHYHRYLEAVNEAVAAVPAFEIDFTGVTLTKEAIMIQGFFDSTLLNDTREALRRELRARELTNGLDSRYILQTAHMTAVRFRAPLAAGEAFAALIESFRGYSFGRSRITELNLVRNDWYMSKRSVEVLQRYKLG